MESYRFQFSGFLALFLGVFVAGRPTAQEHGPLVEGVDGHSSRVKLVTDNRGDRVPDFSGVGYRRGEESIPDAEVEVTLEPTPGDNPKRIQNAINKVSELSRGEDGLRGAVHLKSGTYRVSGPLRIRAGGVVLRGDGQGPGGTTLIATRRQKHSLISAGGGSNRNNVEESLVSITDQRVPAGARQFRVEDASGYETGDEILVVRWATQEWIELLDMDRFEPPNNPWQPGSYHIRYKRIIRSIDGNQITVDLPLVMAIDRKYGGGAIQKFQSPGRIEQVGVENLRLVSAYDESKGHTDEQHAWNGVVFNAVKDGWVRHVTARHFGYSAVHLKREAWRISVLDCANLDPISKISGGRRYSFAVRGQQNLFMRCYSRGGRHDFVTHARVAGPNAFVDCLAEEAKNHTEPHHRWATGILFDNVIVTGQGRKRAIIAAGDRGDWGSGHGWAGAWTVFWNCGSQAFVVMNPPTARNLLAGVRPTPEYEPSVTYAHSAFEKRSGQKLQVDGRVVHDGKAQVTRIHRPVRPRSLYLYQLRQRLGSQAVKRMATPAQRENDVETITENLRKMGKTGD